MALTEEQAKAVADALMSTEEGRAVLDELTKVFVSLNTDAGGVDQAQQGPR